MLTRKEFESEQQRNEQRVEQIRKRESEIYCEQKALTEALTKAEAAKQLADAAHKVASDAYYGRINDIIQEERKLRAERGSLQRYVGERYEDYVRPFHPATAEVAS